MTDALAFLEQFSFVEKFSRNSENIVIGLVRNKAASEKRAAAELSGRSNVHFVQGDLTDYESLKVRSTQLPPGGLHRPCFPPLGLLADNVGMKKSAEDVAAITGGSLDYLIANAVAPDGFTANLPPSLR